MKKKLFPAVIILILAAFVLSAFPAQAKEYEITVRVCLLQRQRALSFSCKRPLVVKDGYTLKKITSNSGRRLVIKIYKGVIYVNGGRTNSDYVYVMTSNYHMPVYLNRVPYRGYFMIGKNGSGSLMAVNHVGLEHYLGGVLGGEIIKSWPIEAIKAQAVAARTYVLYKMAGSKDKLYDVVNSDADQVYLGVRGESPTFNRALKQTRSQVIARGGNVICAYYHSNSGGHTSNSWDVFKKGRAKLLGVKDPFSKGAPNSRWQLTISASSIRWKLNKNGYDVGKIFRLKPHSRDKAGRVAYFQIDHEKGATYVHGSDFRRIIGYRTLKSTKLSIHPKRYRTYRYTKMLASNRGTLTNKNIVNPPGKIPTYFTFYGAGWGHGVGLCQWGAKNMARAGYTYKQILAHYYPRTAICVARRRK